ncbi:MAG: selenocysteine-specific translation elongation factor [Actinobacteria bacterium]|nr:selenocysteine-specific translation elongation factor [Actinomycetota bacterium]
MRVFATAGHVDHGKSTLIKTLTGTNPDRWAEEQERGLTIDLGFAHLETADGRHISFIDVPGHVRYLGNMLAGVGGINGCLFVVDANEGWMPQTEEHLRILHLTGAPGGVVALTKSDLCDADHLELVSLEVIDHVEGTFLQGAAIIPVSATTGAGMTELVDALAALAHSTPASVDRGRPRLFVDRVFAAKGSGTVVTGTLRDGSFAVGDHVVVGPRQREARIRGVQTLGENVERIAPGHRVALNLAGVDHREIRRGDVVVKPNQWFHSNRVDVHLQVLDSLGHRVSRRGAYTVHVGSDEIPARLRVIGPESIGPGESAFVRLHLDRPVPLLPGDHFILRESGRRETVGGGQVLDVDPVRPASRATPDTDWRRVVAERGPITVHDLSLLTGESIAPTVGQWVIDQLRFEAMRDDVAKRIASSGAEGLDVAVFDDIERAMIDSFDGVAIDNGRIRVRGTTDPLLEHPVIGRLRSGNCAPPTPSDIGNADLRRLAKLGVLFERDGEWFHVDALETARSTARELLTTHPDGFTLSQFRDSLGITRKHAVPLATELDARGITRRRDDVRIAGPRL